METIIIILIWLLIGFFNFYKQQQCWRKHEPKTLSDADMNAIYFCFCFMMAPVFFVGAFIMQFIFKTWE